MVIAIAIYTRATPHRDVTYASGEPTTPFAWVEPWFSAPVVTVTETEIQYRGTLIATTESVMRDDSPSFRVDALADRIRPMDLSPASPHAGRRRAHTAFCTAAELMHIDRRILCAGRFVVVELDGDVDRRVLTKIANTVEAVGAYTVVTFRRPT